MSFAAKCALGAGGDFALFVVALACFCGFSAANNTFRHVYKIIIDIIILCDIYLTDHSKTADQVSTKSEAGTSACGLTNGGNENIEDAKRGRRAESQNDYLL